MDLGLVANDGLDRENGDKGSTVHSHPGAGVGGYTVGLTDVIHKKKNQMEKKMANEMETGVRLAHRSLRLGRKYST